MQSDQFSERSSCSSGNDPERDSSNAATYCNVNCTVTVMMTGTGTPFSKVGVNCHCLHCVERRRVEQRNRAQHARILHRATGADGGLDDHDALNARRLRDRGIHRVDVLELLRRLDVAADAHRLRGRGRGRRRGLGDAAGDAADDAAGESAVDTADLTFEAGLDAGLGLDFTGRFHRGGGRVDLDLGRRRGRLAAAVGVAAGAAAAAGPPRTPSSTAASAGCRPPSAAR